MMKVNDVIFKSRDIRGIYPEELNEETAFKIGQAFAAKTGASQIAVGQDMRISSPMLFEHLARGIVSQGANIYNIGQVATECLYFATVNYGYDAGIMITASHNPKEYNGFKMFKRAERGLEFVRGRDLADLIKDYSLNPGLAGEIKELNIWDDYINHIFSLANITKINPFKVVIDAGNGMAGKVIPKISSRLPLEIVGLNFNLDGNFPAHPSNPLLEGVTDQLSKEVVNAKADFGVIFDGDADRIYLVDEEGSFIQGDTTLLFLARYFLEKHPGSSIVYYLICSKAVPKLVTKWGGVPVRTAVGVVELKKAMLDNNAFLGGELSGHYLFKDNYSMDSGFISFLILLEIISQSDKKVSQMAKELSPYFKAAEISFQVQDKNKIIQKAKDNYSDAKQDFLDGITAEYENWWFNLRPSQTEPLLRLTVEANTKDLLEEKKKELTFFIRKSA